MIPSPINNVTIIQQSNITEYNIFILVFWLQVSGGRTAGSRHWQNAPQKGFPGSQGPFPGPLTSRDQSWSPTGSAALKALCFFPLKGKEREECRNSLRCCLSFHPLARDWAAMKCSSTSVTALQWRVQEGPLHRGGRQRSPIKWPSSVRQGSHWNQESLSQHS